MTVTTLARYPLTKSSALACLGLFLLVASPAAARGTVLSIPELEARAGGRIEVPIMIDSVENLAGVKLVLTYDARLLAYRASSKSKQTTPLMHIVNDKQPGRLIIVMAGPTGIKGADFPIFLITFDVLKLKASPSTEIRITESQLMSDKLKDVPHTVRIRPIRILPAAESPPKASAPSE